MTSLTQANAPNLRRGHLGVAGLYCSVAVASATLGGLAAWRLTVALVLASCVLLMAYAVLALVRPGAALGVCLLLLMFIPLYASPEIGGGVVHPAVVCSWVLAAAMTLRAVARHDAPISVSFVDVMAGVFCAVLTLSVVAGARSSGDFARTLFWWAGPYLAIRLFVRGPDDVAFFAKLFSLTALPLIPFALVERAIGWNPFQNLDYNPVEAAVWLPSLTRFGVVRAEASFGHPIALGMCLTTAGLLSIGLALSERPGRARSYWFVIGAAFLICQVVTYSRTPWLMLAAALVIGLVRFPAARRPPVLVTIAILSIAIAIMPQLGSVRAIIESPFSSDSPTAQPSSSELVVSADYRDTLYQRAVEPGVLQPFGNRVSEFAGLLPDGQVSIDNEYLSIADRWGLLAAFMFVVTAGSVLIASLRRPIDTVAETVLVVTVANLVALIAVALITQQSYYIWMLLGACGAITSARFLSNPSSGSGRRT